MSADGTDLSKITGDGVKVIAEAAVAAAAPVLVKQGGWFISHVAAIALSVIMPLVGFLIGRGVERSAVAAVEAMSAGSGSGSAVTEAAAPRTLPYDAKSVAAEAVLGVPFDAHPAHPADAATAAEVDAQ